MNKLTFEEKIYTYQIDFVGHVNNINYIQWMENGRVHLFEAIGIPVTGIADQEGVLPVLTETQIRYKKALFLHNSVKIEIWISQINNASIIMEFRFYNEKNELCSTGWQKGSFIDKDTMKPARLNEKHREAFEKFLIPGENAQ